MTTLQNPGVPRVKLESTIDGNVKSEPIDVEMTSPYADSEDDALEDGGDLDFTNAQQQLWLTQIPRSLWQTCSSIGLDDEIEIGTIRVEGPPENPQRISLKLNSLDIFQVEHKEYNLRLQPSQRRRGEHPGQALVFSEQDLPGYKAKPFSWEQVDDDGNPGQGRSQLFEKRKRDQQRKENDGRFEPYKRKPIPKKTALVGTVVRELEADPVKNKDYWVIEDIKERMSLMPPEQEGTKIYTSSGAMVGKEKMLRNTIMATAEQRRAVTKDKLEKKNRQQESRGAEMSEEDLRELLRELFKEYPGWRLRSLKARTRQSERALTTALDAVAFKHTSGDLAGVYQQKKDETNIKALLSSASVAPEESGTDDDDDEGDENFVDALIAESSVVR